MRALSFDRHGLPGLSRDVFHTDLSLHRWSCEAAARRRRYLEVGVRLAPRASRAAPETALLGVIRP